MPNITLWILAIMALVFLVMGFGKVFARKGFWKYFTMIGGIVLAIYAVVGLMGSYGAIDLGTASGFFLAVTPVAPELPGAGGTGGTGGTYYASNPIYAVTALNSQQSGTTVATITAQSSENALNAFKAVTLGTTTVVPGRTVTMLVVNNTIYHNAKVEPFTVQAGSFPITVLMNKNASVTETIFNTKSVAIDGTLTNQSANGNGAVYNLKDAMAGTSLASTQDMTCVIELTAGVNATTSPAGVILSLGGQNIALKSTSVPVWYNTAGTNSRVWTFDIPALTSASEIDYTISLSSQATKSFPALSSMIKTCYTKEYFIDSNSGTIVYDIADSDGTLKSMGQYKSQVFFQ